MKPKYLYLDFDGVLHPNFVESGRAFCHMPLLEEVLNGTDVRVVVSSSWRFHETQAYITGLFPLSIRGLLCGFTGQAHVGRWARWHEIGQHVSSHGVSDWRALDDAAFEFPPDCPNLIRCDGRLGLQATELRALRDWID